MKVLETENLMKHYGSLTAVNGLSLDVEEGQIFGILGPNGSGKTTTLGIILSIIKADSGRYQWFEGQHGKNEDVLKKVGSLLETPNFYPYMTAEQNLKIVAHIKKAKNANFDDLLKLVNLFHRKDTPFSAYSLGMKQRLAIAGTMVGEPNVLILDEPTNGLDPTGIAEIRDTILKIAQQGKTIFMASHLLDEVEKVCSHVAIIKNGRLLSQGAVGQLLNKETLLEIASENVEILRGLLADAAFTTSLELKNHTLLLGIKKGTTILDVSRFVFEKGIILTHLAEKKHRLEDEFLQITAKN
jgi:ABC-type multidrug transport system ATPase subunit